MKKLIIILLIISLISFIAVQYLIMRPPNDLSISFCEDEEKIIPTGVCRVSNMDYRLFVLNGEIYNPKYVVPCNKIDSIDDKVKIQYKDIGSLLCSLNTEWIDENDYYPKDTIENLSMRITELEQAMEE